MSYGTRVVVKTVGALVLAGVVGYAGYWTYIRAKAAEATYIYLTQPVQGPNGPVTRAALLDAALKQVTTPPAPSAPAPPRK